MATAVTSQQEGFTLENFQKLYSQSAVKNYLSAGDIEAIDKAVTENDLGLIHNVYDLLVANKITNDRDDKNFIATKNKIMDDFVIEAKNIENSYVSAPRRKMAESATEREQREAENILKNL